MRRWIPVAVWGVLILAASTEFGAAGRTERLLEPILHWFDPRMSWARIYEINILVRKTAHVIEFAILAVLLWRTRDFLTAPRRPLRDDLRVIGFVYLLTVVIAVSSESVQYTTSTRAASPWDVALNMGGVTAGLLGVLIWKYRQRRVPATDCQPAAQSEATDPSRNASDSEFKQ